MELLNPNFDLDGFFERLRTARQRILLLDYDGTLAPFSVDRDTAEPYPEIPPLLAEIIRSPRSRTAIVSGRAVADVSRLLNLNPAPEIFGSHGAERLALDGSYRAPQVSEEVRAVLDRARRWAVEHGLEARTESKPAGIAFHWRGLENAEVERIKRALDEAADVWRAGSGLEIHGFDGGRELRLPGITKGDVVRTVFQESGGDSTVAYLGDDVTDEDAFEAIAGRGLSVLVRPALRPTKADIWLKPPDELLSFLRRWLKCLS